MKKNLSLILLCSILIILLSPIKTAANSRNTTPKTYDEVLPVIAKVESKMELETPSAVLIEGSTGTIIYQKNKDEKLPPASITKVMTLLLIFEAIDEGLITLTDEVTVSEHAASMGGSQVYLEPYEVQDVDTLLKCISIASANDASVALGEHIAGSHEEFVAQMNARAKELGMNNTHFVNCTGLDADNHYSTAYDVALMSRELITKHPEISNYCLVWMDTFVHETRRGRTEFGLTNTNKLIKSYNGITGLKTGSTSLAKYCLSATAKRDNMDLIAVIMGAPDTKTRFAEAAKLLNHGFANYSIFVDENTNLEFPPVRVIRGVEDEVEGKSEKDFSYLCKKDINTSEIQKNIEMFEEIPAPVTTSDKIGEITYTYQGDILGKLDIYASNDISKAKFSDCLVKSIKRYFLAQ